MNAVEIEEAVSSLALQPFDAAEFPFAFLAAFGNKDTTIKRLRKGESNASDLLGGLLQRNNIHMAVCEPGSVRATLTALRESPKTTSAKAKFIIATDGVTLEAEDLVSGETIAPAYPDFAKHFGFFLPLAGISTVKEIKNNPIDVKATGRLNKLYVELLRENPDWSKAERRHDMNHFMARLIFCFFAEDTGIFHGEGVFTATVDRMSERDASNAHQVISTLFRAMNTKSADHAAAKLPGWTTGFPYVNGGLFSGSADVPRFSRIARSYFLHAGELNWREINPDIFGSMIQAVADDEERGALGMHYTSVPNILKVLNPLFVDDLRSQLEAAGDNARMLLNLRKRIAKIRVFDPACGSGNFLVIAYKEMRAIEAEINRRRGEPDFKTEIPLTNFRGIELRDFPAEVARLALIIAEYQCDVLYRGQKEALAEFLPLDAMNWITCGNALRLDWLSICPPTGTGVKFAADDLFHTPLDQAQIDFQNEGGETYVCGNPPYLGGKGQSREQKGDLAVVFQGQRAFGELDYVAGWFVRAAQYINQENAVAAFVATNSINQGAQVHQLWPILYSMGVEIKFAYEPFKWANNANFNATVTCSIVALGRVAKGDKKLFGTDVVQTAQSIGPYLIPNRDVIVFQSLSPISRLPLMLTGNSPYDGGHLILTLNERRKLTSLHPQAARLVRRMCGSADYINGEERFCVWIADEDLALAMSIDEIRKIVSQVRQSREDGGEVARGLANIPHRFRYTHTALQSLIIVPRVSSERREYVPAGSLDASCIVSDAALAIYDPEIWILSLLVSRLHMIWVRAVAGKLESRIRYSSALCYNTFPVPLLTEQNKADLTRCAENILLAREAHFPATIADLYDPDTMPVDLRRAHDENDEVLERIYIGRRFKNDTERLEKLFELYTKMTATQPPPKKKGRTAA